MEKKRVYIVGFAPSWKETKWDDMDAEIWCLNEFYKYAKEVKNFRCTRWFEIHNRESRSKATPEHVAFLKQCPVPLFMWQRYDDLPNSVKFPKDEIIQFFEDKGFLGARYFTNSISWMVGLAIYEGFEEIILTGTDMATDSEYGWQRPSVEYFIGLAEGMGIKFSVPASSDLLKCTQLYGFESDNRNRVWLRSQVQELSKRQQVAAGQEIQLQHNLHQTQLAQAEMRGAQMAYKEILKRTQ